MRVYGWLLKLYPARFREEYEPAAWQARSLVRRIDAMEALRAD
jgi:hypothetical protein